MNRMPALAVMSVLTTLVAGACPVKPTTASGAPNGSLRFAVWLDADRPASSSGPDLREHSASDTRMPGTDEVAEASCVNARASASC